jgi:copper chaperone NosL
MRQARVLVLLAAAGLAGCSRGPAPPAVLDTRTDACRFCRMSVSEQRFAAQLAAPGEEPLFFDDIGCLRDYLRREGELPRDTVAYVADHRTGAWLRAGAAVYTRISGETPMGSRIVAHESPQSRASDPDAVGGSPVPASDILSAGGTGPPGSETREVR